MITKEVEYKRGFNAGYKDYPDDTVYNDIYQCCNYPLKGKWRGIKGEIMKMTLIEALEKLAELNNYEEILVKIKDDDEPTPIDLEIDDIRKFADDPDQTFDLIVTEYTIRELDENGNEKLGEPLYRVVK